MNVNHLAAHHHHLAVIHAIPNPAAAILQLAANHLMIAATILQLAANHHLMIAHAILILNIVTVTVTAIVGVTKINAIKII